MKILGQIRAFLREFVEEHPAFDLQSLFDNSNMKSVVRLRLYFFFQYEHKEQSQIHVEKISLQRRGKDLEEFPPRSGAKLLPRRTDRTCAQLKKELVDIGTVANVYGQKHDTSGVWQAWKERLPGYLERGGSARVLEGDDDLVIRAFSGHGYHDHLLPPLLAAAYSLEGLRALKNGHLDDAAICAEQGSCWTDSRLFIDEPKSRLRNRAKAGGIARRETFSEVKQLVAQLLLEMSPPAGWKSKSKAINAVANEIASTHPKVLKKPGLSADNLEQTIRGWVRKEPERFVINVHQRSGIAER